MTTPQRTQHRTALAIGATVAIAAFVVMLFRAPPVESPRTGALTAPEKLTLEYRPTLSFGDNTTLHLSDHRYMFGPGRRAANTDTTDSSNPLVLGLGGTVMDGPDYRMRTELGFGKMLDRDNFSLGESLTLFSSSLTRSLSQNLDFNADYSLLNGASTRSEDWALGFQYRISEQAHWQLKHREIRDQTGTGSRDRLTRMEYRVAF